MNNYYQNNLQKINKLSLFLLACFFSMSLFSQSTTISTELGTNYDGVNGILGNGLITFVIENTNATPKLLKQIDYYWATGQSGAVPELWYSATSLSGGATIATPVWTLLTTGTPLTVTVNGYLTTLSGLSLSIPPATQYRFALLSNSGLSYSWNSAAIPTPNIFSADGLNLKLGDNQITAANTGYAGIFPNGNLTPRFFTGRVILSDPPTVAPSCATNLSPANNATNVPTIGSLSWTADPNATSYDVYLGTSSTPPLVANITNGNNYNFPSSLATNTTYYYQIVPKNNIGTAMGCPIFSFVTGSAVSYCIPASTDCGLGDEILNVTAGTLNNSSSNCSGTGYTDYTITSVGVPEFAAGSNVPISVAIGGGGNDSVGVWIDYNKNGSFEPTEYVFLGGSLVATTLSGNLSIPTGAVLGTTRMRVRVKYDTAFFDGTSACSAYLYGETEDYSVTIVSSSACLAPVGLTAKGVTSTSDSIKWNKNNLAANYQYAVTTSSTPPVSGTATLTNNDTTFLINSLTPFTQYYLHVRSNCGSGNLSNWATLGFFSIRENDICAEAIDITTLLGVNIADTVNKSTLVNAGIEGSPVNSLCSNISTGGINDVWYKFTAPANGDSVIITGASGTSGDWVFQLFAICGGPQIACNDDGQASNPFGNTLMPFIGICGLTPGAVYYIRTYPYSPTVTVTKTCKLYVYSGGSCPTPPANDACNAAVDISGTCGSPVAGTTVNATASGSLANTNCGSSFATQSDVWYKFNTGNSLIVPTIKVTNIDTVGGKNVYFSIYHGSCANLVYDGCLNTPTASDSIIAVISGVDANQDYFVRIYSIANLQQTSFSISLCDSTSTLIVDSSGQGLCNVWGSVIINSAFQNNNKWVRIVNNNGLMAEINANGQNLGSTSFSIYRNNSGTVRRDPSRNIPLLGKEYLDRNITITPTNQPTTPVSLRIYFTNQELNALIAAGGDGYADVASINGLVITKNQQACGASFLPASPGVILTPTSNGTFADGAYVEFSVSSFSTFFLHGGNTPLPVNLLSFNAQRSGKVNNITWSTAQEVNTREFIVERSSNARDYFTIGRAAAAINSSSIRNYTLTDYAPIKGINYYRVRIVDQDNISKLSNVRNVRNEGTADIAVYPNPVKDILQVSIASDKADRATITVVDLNGKLVYSKVANILEGANNLNINTVGLSNGTYIIKVQLTEDLVVKKFSKL